MVGQAKPTYEELLTSVTEVELILNSRPLTYMSATDLEEPLTPTHLINGRCLVTLLDHLCYLESDVDFSPSAKLTLNRRMKHLHSILEHLWRRGKKKYLLELRENHQYSSGKTQDQVSVGDVVIIHDDLPRGMWRLGVITEKIKGGDNAVRGMIVCIKSGRGPASFLRRPIQKLYTLEVKQKEFNAQNTEEPGGRSSIENSVAPESSTLTSDQDLTEPFSTTTDSIPSVLQDDHYNDHSTRDKRPQRRAAANARDRIVASLMDT